MGMDDSFKKPGSVPFKWEIKPGVPKAQQHHHHHLHQHNHSPPSSLSWVQSSEFPSPKLRPPPSRSYVFSPEKPWTWSFQSTPSARFDRWQFDRPLLARSDSVPPGCFLSHLLRRLPSWKVTRKLVVEPNYGSNLDKLSRWSLSLRKSLSPLWDSSMSSSSMSSNQSLPTLVGNAGWDGFGPLLLSFVTGDLN